MTVAVEIVITCDVDDCTEQFLSSENSLPAAEKQAEQHGWLLPDDGVDRCPEHAALVEPS